MVDESLKAYLLQKLSYKHDKTKFSLKENIDHLFSYSNPDNPFDKDITLNLIEAISSCLILDPACGSGAFPMGALHRMVFLLGKLDPNNIHWKNAQLQKAKQDMELAMKMIVQEIRETAVESAEMRINFVKESFASDHHELDYTRKLFLIENCIYGVDIQQIAVQISKLRFFISLIADQKVIDAKHNRNILSMPNLETKFVAANTLIPIERPDGMIVDPTVEKLENELHEIRQRIFFTKKYSDKKKLKSEEDKKRVELKDALLHSGFGEVCALQMASWNPFDPINSAEFFDSEAMFGVAEGFDIVLGNPPYVEHKKLKDISQTLRKFYSTYSGTADLYVYFYENGVKQLKKNGILVFITSNKFIKTSYGENLRKYFTQYRINEIIDFTEIHVFEALVASCIFSISKVLPERNKIIIAFADDTLFDFADVSDFVMRNNFFLNQNSLSEKIWQLETETKLNLKRKIEKGSINLRETGSVNVFRGVTTGYNPAFIIDEEIKRLLIKEDKANESIIKPMLQGRNIKKWIYKETDDYLIFTRKGININRFPSIKRHLAQFKSLLEPGIGRKPGSYNWYEIQDNTAYYPEFDKEKIIWGLTADKWAFAYDDKRHFLPSNGYILTSSTIPIKYLLGVLNSKLMEFYFGFIGIMTAGNAFTLKYETVIEFPVKIIDKQLEEVCCESCRIDFV